MTKQCAKCLDIKVNLDFSKSQLNRKSGTCKMCIKIYKETYYLENKEYIALKVNNYKTNNKEKIQLLSATYYKNNKRKINIKNLSYQKNRRRVDKQFNLRMIVSNSIWYGLKRNNSSKNVSSITKLSYTIEELKLHLEKQFESWMSWSNWGRYDYKSWDDNNNSTWTWQIDHIIPHSAFKYTSMDDGNFKRCWALENLRPLSSKQNNLKGNK
jgi:hypothetical protein